MKFTEIFPLMVISIIITSACSSDSSNKDSDATQDGEAVSDTTITDSDTESLQDTEGTGSPDKDEKTEKEDDMTTDKDEDEVAESDPENEDSDIENENETEIDMEDSFENDEDGFPEKLPRIEAVRTGTGGAGYFRIKDTENVFVPRGNNYIKLLKDKNDNFYHSTFQPGEYDSSAAENALNHMRQSGYNMVRVFIDPGHWERVTGINGEWEIGTLDISYLDNVADFLIRSEKHGIYVMMTMLEIPFNKKYFDIVTSDTNSDIIGWNALYMNTGHINAKKQYLTDFIAEIKGRIEEEKMSIIFAWSLENEAFYDAAHLPFSKKNLTVQTADGLSYSMATESDRQQAADANLVNFSNVMTDAIKSADPDAMVTIGMFSYYLVGRDRSNGLFPICTEDEQRTMGLKDSCTNSGERIEKCTYGEWVLTENCSETAIIRFVETRFPPRPSSLSLHSKLDFLDVHIYPADIKGVTYSMEKDLESIEWSDVYGPILMGEYGAFRNRYEGSYPETLTAAALEMRDLQIESCQYNFSGWLFWTWDTDEQSQLFNMLENGGTINGTQAPIARSDPCKI